MGGEPVNSMTLELWTALSDALTELEADPAVRGVVFASEVKKDIFTGGLPSPPRIARPHTSHTRAPP